MTELEYITERIDKLRTALLDRPPGVQMVTFNGVTVMYSSIEKELESLVTRQTTLTSGAGDPAFRPIVIREDGR